MKKHSKPTDEKEELQHEEEMQQQEPAQEENCECNQELEQKYNELNDSHLRLVAEFDNYRKRTIREKADMLKSAGENVLVNILPLIDDFERALKAIDEANAAKEGIELIYNKFVSFLTQNGVKVIDTENQPFDMDVHEAVTTIPAPSDDMKGKIVDTISKGYTLNDKVIRFPKVVVGE